MLPYQKHQVVSNNSNKTTTPSSNIPGIKIKDEANLDLTHMLSTRSLHLEHRITTHRI